MATAKSHHTKTPIALTIAGSDSGGGAGIQADLKTFSALGAYGASVITAVTAQNTLAVSAVHDLPCDIVQAQLISVLDDLDVTAIKIGMLCSAEIIQVICEILAGTQIPVVLDPVMVAKSGASLLQTNAIESLKTSLLPLATVLTPNLPEAAMLLQTNAAANESEMQRQGEALAGMGAKAVVMKGGHAGGDDCVDLLITPDAAVSRFCARRVATNNTHGTGCTLSAAITAYLASGKSLLESVSLAHDFLQQAILGADQLQIGRGHGPVHHFHRFW